ncbi:hypothetical protein FDP41_011762 [Naegleria fowleri]|uniref:Rho-GAP domain-containing protein n=1 Tax=Naegleria fowleri TaxID=5763 RepID=A0A6A5C487_NAEFO|nr:uncharacterized protein FDP41_011762 [Naegleria fowleri]KAF0981901.1 hypothetical protein FDP41_011762 [Naegleria fowleri]
MSNNNNNNHLNNPEEDSKNPNSALLLINDTKASHQIELVLDDPPHEHLNSQPEKYSQNCRPSHLFNGKNLKQSFHHQERGDFEHSLEVPSGEEKSLFEFVSNLCCSAFKLCDCHLLGDLMLSFLRNIVCFQSLSKTRNESLQGVHDRNRNHKVFKESLIVVLEREAKHSEAGQSGISLDNNFHNRVPSIAEECLKMLEENASKEGIFRIPGHALEIEKIVTAANSNQKLNLRLFSVHTVASVLKRFVRELPEPLLPSHMYKEWTALSTLHDVHEEKENLLNLFKQLPIPNRTLFIRILKLLRKISQPPCLESSRMNDSNLAFIWGMNFLRPSDSEIRTDIGKVSHAIILCIREYENLQQCHDEMLVNESPSHSNKRTFQ